MHLSDVREWLRLRYLASSLPTSVVSTHLALYILRIYFETNTFHFLERFFLFCRDIFRRHLAAGLPSSAYASTKHKKIYFPVHSINNIEAANLWTI